MQRGLRFGLNVGVAERAGFSSVCFPALDGKVEGRFDHACGGFYRSDTSDDTGIFVTWLSL